MIKCSGLYQWFQSNIKCRKIHNRFHHEVKTEKLCEKLNPIHDLWAYSSTFSITKFSVFLLSFCSRFLSNMASARCGLHRNISAQLFSCFTTAFQPGSGLNFDWSLLPASAVRTHVWLQNCLVYRSSCSTHWLQGAHSTTVLRAFKHVALTYEEKSLLCILCRSFCGSF